MPDETPDGTIVLDHGDREPHSEEGDSDMADNLLSPSTAELLQAQMFKMSEVAQANFITVNKAIDYDFMENKRMVTLDEAVGVREVQAAQTPGGPAPRTV